MWSWPICGEYQGEGPSVYKASTNGCIRTINLWFRCKSQCGISSGWLIGLDEMLTSVFGDVPKGMKNWKMKNALQPYRS